MLDNHLYWGNALELDTRRIAWRRALDMNDRALRSIVSGLGGATNGAAARGRVRHHRRLRGDGGALHGARPQRPAGAARADGGGLRRDGSIVTAHDLKADGAMAALLRDALMPNLVQTLEGSPALVHGGPFANIAHGCNSVKATTARPQAGRCGGDGSGVRRRSRRREIPRHQVPAGPAAPACAVVVATVRALKMHGGVARPALGREDVGGGRARRGEPGAPCGEHAASSGCPWWWR